MAVADITHNDTKLWAISNLTSGTIDPNVVIATLVIYEYNISNTLSMLYNRTLNIQLPPLSMIGNSQGVCVLNSTTLITVRGVSPGPYQLGQQLLNPVIIEVNISNNGTITDIFTPLSGRNVESLLYTTTGKLIIVNKNETTGIGYISQYLYPSGVLEFDIVIPQFISNKTQLFEDNGIIYFNTNNLLYRITNASPYTITYVNNMVNSPIGVSSKNICNTVSFVPNIIPPSGPSPTPTKTLTPTPTPTKVTVYTIYKRYSNI
jgi:hypothetical protein